MKKTYIAPSLEVVKFDQADIIATSAGVGFGSGSTDIMHSREDDWDFFEE